MSDGKLNDHTMDHECGQSQTSQKLCLCEIYPNIVGEYSQEVFSAKRVENT